MADNNTEELQPVQDGKVKLTTKQLRKKILLEAADLLKGAAFPFIVMCVLSSLIIMFSTYTDDLAVTLIAVVGGEAMFIAAMILFGRTNGSDAYKKKISNDTKRQLNNPDEKVLFKTGEYSPWKGFVIGFITCIPFIIFQIIDCFGDYGFVDFMLEFACGWATSPLDLAEGVPDACYFLMILVPVGILGGFYIYGKYWEDKRQQKITRAEDDKRKGSKKHYYEENKYDGGRRYEVDTSKKGKNKKK
ncbi:MAG: hypothetical protein LUF82_01020 [Clostridia bacterium]|nr:hypothetical protein [Clostridia bacterium]